MPRNQSDRENRAGAAAPAPGTVKEGPAFALASDWVPPTRLAEVLWHFITTTGDYVAILDELGRIVYENLRVPAATRLHGPDARWTDRLSDDQRAPVHQILSAVVKTQQPAQFGFVGAASFLPGSHRAHVLPAGPAPSGLLVHIPMATHTAEASRVEHELRTMGEDLAKRVFELSQANRELETFSYTVSHDLRTPLTIIENYAHVLQLSAQNPTDATSRARDGIRHAVKRMSGLIDNILRLSRVSRSEPHLTQSDLVPLVHAIMRELREREPALEVEIKTPEHAWAFADESLVRIVLANLLSNAWKFTSKGRRPRIEFGVQAGLDASTFFVRDNGVGFDPAQASSLFQLFQRLHPADQFPGTGIGLATVRRAIERQGGAVWADSRPGEGATFYFSLRNAPTRLAERPGA